VRSLLLAAAVVFACACARRSAPAVLAALPDFAMASVGPDAETAFGRREMLGKVWVVDFVYTRCAGPCPLLTERLGKLAASLPPAVGLLTVTVDPEGDTPERLRAYAKSYGADPRRWVFLRGTQAQTYELLFAGFRLPMSSDPKAAPEARVQHSTRFVLVDKNAGIRGFYDGLGDLDNAALARDAKRLLEADS
jgi:cytochrome oxidase Cu insertion factor (SCO1/SenC/PrrC family)